MRARCTGDDREWVVGILLPRPCVRECIRLGARVVAGEYEREQRVVRGVGLRFRVVLHVKSVARLRVLAERRCGEREVGRADALREQDLSRLKREELVAGREVKSHLPCPRDLSRPLRAKALLDLIVRVFEAVIDKRVASAAPVINLDELASAVAEKLRPQLAPSPPDPSLLSPTFRGAVVRQRVRETVGLLARLAPQKSLRSLNGSVRTWLTGVTGFGGTGCSWNNAPVEKFVAAQNALSGLIFLLRKFAVTGESVEQLSLFQSANKAA